ncbi:MAG: glycosyltransferase family 4 protein [Candidatus Limnocylindria bacterium]
MRILFTKRAYAPVGGSESLCYQFATRLAARGHDVRVVCAWPTDHEGARYPVERFAPRVFDDHRVFTDRGVEVVQVRPKGGLLGIAADATTLVDLMRGAVLERYAQDRELVHNVGREYLDSSLAAAEELDLPLVLTPLAHPGQFHGGDAPSDFARYRRAAAITTMTEWERGWYVAQGVAPWRAVATGMGPNASRSREGASFRAARRIPAAVPMVLYIGRKERYKGYIHLLDAAELVWRRHPEARFVFIGIQGFYSSFFDDFARYADERIVDIEAAPGAVKTAALDACDVFAMPSIHETFGIGYLEAWLHGKPVIGGDIPALREVIADGVDGLLVRQRAAEVAEAIVRLLDDPALRAAMGRAGAAKVRERWDWERVMDRVELAYQRAVEARRPAEASEILA